MVAWALSYILIKIKLRKDNSIDNKILKVALIIIYHDSLKTTAPMHDQFLKKKKKNLLDSSNELHAPWLLCVNV